MRTVIFLLLLIYRCNSLLAQQGPVIYTIRADSVKITNDCDTAELIIENHTQNIPGFLYNKGKGRTEFRRAIKLDDSTLVLGGDTIVIQGAVPPLQKVLIAGSHLDQNNDITIGDGNRLNVTGNDDAFIKIRNLHGDDEAYMGVGHGDVEFTVIGGEFGQTAGIKIMPQEFYGIWVYDDFYQRGLFYGGEYAPAGDWDVNWIPHIGYVRQQISDSLTLMRDIRLQVKRTTVNNTGYSATAADNLIAFTSLTAPRTVTLPDPSTMPEKVMIIKDEAGAAATHNITINVTAGGNIDGTSSKTINTNYGTIELYSNGLQWFTK